NGLNDIAAEVPVLRALRFDGGAGIRAPDDLISGSFDLFPFEKILTFLISRKVDNPIPLLAHGFCDGKENGVAEPAAGEEDALIRLDLGWCAGWPHYHNRLARLEIRAEAGGNSEFECDQRKQPFLAVDPGAGERDTFHQEARAVGAPRLRFEILQ